LVHPWYILRTSLVHAIVILYWGNIKKEYKAGLGKAFDLAAEKGFNPRYKSFY